MPTYGTETTTSAPIPDTIEGVLAMIDQLQAARSDLTDAWRVFKFGPREQTEEGTSPETMPLPDDRIRCALFLLQEEVSFVRSIAEDIRSRA